MNRLTRLVVLLRAVAAALAAVVVVGCIYCRLTTDAVFGARFAAAPSACVIIAAVLEAVVGCCIFLVSEMQPAMPASQRCDEQRRRCLQQRIYETQC